LRKTFPRHDYEDQILNLALPGQGSSQTRRREVMSKPLPQFPGPRPSKRVTHILSTRTRGLVDMGQCASRSSPKYDLMSTVASLMEQKR